MKFRRLLAILAVLALGLSACGPDDFHDSSQAEASSSQAAAQEASSLARAGGEDPDPVERSDYWSGPDGLLDDILRRGKNLPEEIWWISEQAVRETFGIDGYISAECVKGIAHFDFSLTDMEGLPERYEITQEDWETRTMEEPPNTSWRELTTRFDFYVAIRPTQELPEEFADASGHWEPHPDRPGYELSVTAETGEGTPLAARIRWQREGRWFYVHIPAHCLEDFWDNAENLWKLVNVDSDKGWAEADVFDSPEYQLQELMRYGEDLPDQVWWLDEEKFRSFFGVTGKIVTSSYGIIRFEGVLETSLETAKLYGITEEEWALRNTDDWPHGLWEGQTSSAVLLVTTRPQEEPPEEFTHEGLEFQPVEGHPEYEQFVPDRMNNGHPTSIQLRWQREGFWFLAQIPAHLLEDFLENEESLWRKVTVDRSLAVELEEPEETPRPHFDPLESSGYFSHFKELQKELEKEVEEGWLEGYYWPDYEEAARAFPLEDPERIGSGGAGDNLIELDFLCVQDLERAADFWGIPVEELEKREMKSWPWDSYQRIASDYCFWYTGRPVEGESPLPYHWTRWETEKLSAARQSTNDLGKSVLNSAKGQSEPLEERESLSDYKPPEFQEAEGHPGTEIAVVEAAPNGNPLQVRLRWEEPAGDGKRYVFMAEIPGYYLEEFWKSQRSLFRFCGPAEDSRQATD